MAWMHAAERDDRQRRTAGQRGKACRPQRGRTGMGAGGKQRRDQHGIRPVADRCHKLGMIMHGRAMQPALASHSPAARPAMMAISAPTLRQRRIDRHQHNAAPPPRCLPHLIEQRAPFFQREAIVTHHHCRSARKPSNCAHQIRLRDPLIGHQPYRRNAAARFALASMHAASYSDADERA